MVGVFESAKLTLFLPADSCFLYEEVSKNICWKEERVRRMRF